MVVGICRIELALHGVKSLKEKRGIVRRVIDRTTNRFNVAAAEVAAQDSHRVAVIGLTVVSEDGRHAQSMLDKIVEYVGGSTEAPIMSHDVELVHMGEFHSMRGGTPHA